jgi:hypothetical protein
VNYAALQRRKKGRFLSFLKNRPDNSALLRIRPNIRYAELGITVISSVNTMPRPRIGALTLEKFKPAKESLRWRWNLQI